MAETSKLNMNCVKFGRNERYVPEIFDKKKQNKNSSNNKKEKTPEEEFKASNFVDRSAQLSASLTSLALSNMINLRRFEKTQKSQINAFINEKSGLKTEIINPFAKKD
jgi:hypothetical protein